MISRLGLRNQTRLSTKKYLLERPENLSPDSLLLLVAWRLLSTETAEAGCIWSREIRGTFGGE